MSAQPAFDTELFASTALALDQAMEAEEESRIPRGHLGMSQIGAKDARTLWLKFRWSLPNKLSARTLRIFNLGRAIEAEMIRQLRRISGIELHERDPESDEQFRFTLLGGHFAGALDGCIRGLVEAPKTWHVLEVKSVKDERFRELKKRGAKDWSSEYHGQLQCYMGASGMTRSLFVAYDKNTSEVYLERVKPERFYWEGAQAKAERIINAAEPPESSYPNEDWYEAKFLPPEAREVYWGRRLPEPNCRNCRFAYPMMEGDEALWACGFHRSFLPKERQVEGCPSHNWLPSLVPAQVLETHRDCIQYQTHDGLPFWNAEHNPGAIGEQVYSSWELAALSEAGLTRPVMDDINLQSLRTTFEGRIQKAEPVSS